MTIRANRTRFHTSVGLPYIHAHFHAPPSPFFEDDVHRERESTWPQVVHVPLLPAISTLILTVKNVHSHYLASHGLLTTMLALRGKTIRRLLAI